MYVIIEYVINKIKNPLMLRVFQNMMNVLSNPIMPTISPLLRLSLYIHMYPSHWRKRYLVLNIFEGSPTFVAIIVK